MSENNNHIINTLNEEETKENEEIEDIKYDENGMPIYDEDENDIEIRRIIFEKQQNKNYNNYDFTNNSTEIKEKKNKQNKCLSLIQFNEIILKKIEKNKPKNFISKRCIEKKQELNIVENLQNIKSIKRTFNPRLVPYYLSDKYINYKNTKQPLNINEDFPSLT